VDGIHTCLRTYDAAVNGPPLAVFSLDHSALDTDSEDPELDLEGSAWLGGRVFWIGSHGRSKKGKPRPNRHRLFATAIGTDGTPEIVGQAYSNLVRDVAEAVSIDLDPELPPKEGGLSIEGLSASENDGELLIGLRSPLYKSRAVVLPFRNPLEVVGSGAPARFGDPILLDLGGLGIRSIDWWPERRSYLLLAGPTGGGDRNFRLMRWSGTISTRPEPLDVVDFNEFGANRGTSPEAVLIEPDSETVYVLFDEGNRRTAGTKCKDSGNQSFRSIAVNGL
jgi:hypothetical protein